MVRSTEERKVVCESCGNQIYPRINPVVIVGVINGEKMLLTENTLHAPGQYSLVAGFVEIGETLEQAIAREVREETNIGVKNIKYFGSQPWGIGESVITGYFAELDGDDRVELNDGELRNAEWIDREDIPYDENRTSITKELMMQFKFNGRKVLE